MATPQDRSEWRGLDAISSHLYQQSRLANFRRTDTLFAWLLIGQWLGAIALGLAVDPKFRLETADSAAIFMTGLVVSLPVILAFVRTGEEPTRHAVAVAQMLTSALLMHLTGGRIETHFHVFVSLAFLAFYRDWRVLMTAAAVSTSDHFVRGLLTPQLIYGTDQVTWWRPLEHAAWIVLCNFFLVRSCRQSDADMRATAAEHARLELSNAALVQEAEEHQHTSQALAESEERFQLVAKVTYGVIWDWNIETGAVWMNENFADAFGHGSYDAAMDIRAWRNNIHPDDHDRVVESINSFLEGEDSVWQAEYRFRRADETYADVLDRGQAMRDGSGRAYRLVSAIVDISAQKAQEAALTAAAQAAEAANQAKSEFLANMSHEIRTPMNGIIGMTELALGTDLDATQRDYLETVQSSANSLLCVINDVLDFSKIEARKLEFEREEFTLRGVVEDAIRDHAATAKAKSLVLSSQLTAEVPERVVGDAARLRQVMTNLIGNAVKFTENGSVAVCADLEAQEEKWVTLRFKIADTGIGIHADHHSSIFDAFAQADSSTQRKHGGTGLGLAICNALVQKMSGRIWVESELDRGSIFCFTARFERAAEVKHAPATMLEGASVLLVAQTPSETRWVASALAPHHVKVHFGADDHHIIDLLQRARLVKQPFDCVLFGKDVREQRICKLAEEIHSDPGISGVDLLALKGGQPQCEAAGVRAISASTSRDLADALAASLLHPRAEVRRNPAPVLRPMHVLLAEDNPVNQKLAVRLLESAGHSVTVAENGRAALEFYQESEFDLLLMDVQMPGISGLECAARIRELEQKTGKRIPILAITAHAMKGAEEQCTAAGMDGYLAKPFRSKELFRAIAELVVPVAQPSRRTSAQWDHALMEELIAIFHETKPKMLYEIESAIAAEDPEALRAAAHTLRGSLSVFDAPGSSALALRLERLAETGTTEGGASILKRLAHEISTIREAAARASAAGS